MHHRACPSVSALSLRSPVSSSLCARRPLLDLEVSVCGRVCAVLHSCRCSASLSDRDQELSSPNMIASQQPYQPSTQSNTFTLTTNHPDTLSFQHGPSREATPKNHNQHCHHHHYPPTLRPRRARQRDHMRSHRGRQPSLSGSN